MIIYKYCITLMLRVSNIVALLIPKHLASLKFILLAKTYAKR